MARDNFSMLFSGGGAASPPVRPPPDAPTTVGAPSDDADRCGSRLQPPTASTSGRDAWSAPDAPPARSEQGTPAISSDGSAPNNAQTTPQERPPQYTRPGTESFQYIKKFGMGALKPLRDLQLAEKLNSMNLEMEQAQREKEAHRIQLQRQLEERDNGGQQAAAPSFLESDEILARELQEKEEEDECERIKVEADVACHRAGARYDALVKFTSGCPTGTYEEFVEFLLMGGGRSADESSGEGLGDDYDSLAFENFYDQNSEYRQLWNDNLTLGLPAGASTLEGRAFVPAEATESGVGSDTVDPWHFLEPGGTSSNTQRQRTSSEDERLRNFGQTLRQRTLTEGERIKKDAMEILKEGERIKNQIAQVDKEKIKQSLGSAANVLSNVSSFALKPLRDLQLAEKLNALNIDMEEEEARREIEQYNRAQEEKRDMEEMMRLKKEAEEMCMNATREHLFAFISANPSAKYHEWIEELHPENAHDGALLEGLGKTIDHRFYVEESDHRRLWNDNLTTFVDPNSGSNGRDFVPARARQTTDTGEMVVAADILTGSVLASQGGDAILLNDGETDDMTDVHLEDGPLDMIAFD